ncbi:hypothetical protein GTY86_29975, partial [Streptomyces sp. SID5770]|nr:hypothetical protein [Streptomyces sp. SID5770]
VPAPAYEEQPFRAGEPHPFFGEQVSLNGLAESPAEPAPLPSEAIPAPTASVTDADPAAPASHSFKQTVLPPPAGAEMQDWM